VGGQYWPLITYQCDVTADVLLQLFACKISPRQCR